ncbi:23S rRNA (pseudouridine(1915)-N(3))-methyltransferase RlmH [Mycoplasmopsis agassizii]|uniref:23S rRNA (pseudouridine(1915)-N(3))-methyltransferase RlmH n=1 Tax=Mycoplasmopsis agassizii TaxID=33922 RepID=UPI0035288709
MKVNLIVFGTLNSASKTLYNDFENSLKKKVSFNLIELKETPHESIDFEKQKHTNLLLSKLNKSSKNFYLTFRGDQFTSEQFAKKINYADVTFIIGPSNGLDENLLKKNDISFISFSKMTIAHQLFRIVLMEQIYRAVSILNNSKYHK